MPALKLRLADVVASFALDKSEANVARIMDDGSVDVTQSAAPYEGLHLSAEEFLELVHRYNKHRRIIL